MITINSIEDFQALSAETQARIFKHITILFLADGALEESVGSEIFNNSEFENYMNTDGEKMQRDFDFNNQSLPKILNLLISNLIKNP